ncbi:MAG: pantetheine-phosphate adenylyltransferase [Clostridia bacterium]|nr:MAG: pantetheine-phosphate adenylyltransferase [Clostridia bacterium]
MERVAVYPGTFDPFTNGHLDIAVRATKLFDRVIIGVAEENYKDNLFSLEERVSLVREVVKGYDRIAVTGFFGLLVDFAVANGAIAVVRGLRAVSDFEYEFQMSLMNKKLREDIETVFLMTSSEYAFLSSRIIKQIASLNGCIDGLVPPLVEAALRRKFASKGP